MTRYLPFLLLLCGCLHAQTPTCRFYGGDNKDGTRWVEGIDLEAHNCEPPPVCSDGKIPTDVVSNYPDKHRKIYRCVKPKPAKKAPTISGDRPGSVPLVSGKDACDGVSCWDGSNYPPTLSPKIESGKCLSTDESEECMKDRRQQTTPADITALMEQISPTQYAEISPQGWSLLLDEREGQHGFVMKDPNNELDCMKGDVVGSYGRKGFTITCIERIHYIGDGVKAK